MQCSTVTVLSCHSVHANSKELSVFSLSEATWSLTVAVSSYTHVRCFCDTNITLYHLEINTLTKKGGSNQRALKPFHNQDNAVL